jgi:hypothetical protein
MMCSWKGRCVVRVKSVEESGARWVEKSILAYLSGEQDLKWIAGIVRGNHAGAKRTVESLKIYARPDRYQELSHWLDGQN